MKLFQPKQTPDAPEPHRSPRAEEGEGTNRTQRRPDPKAEPIPDGEHKYVPRSPYRTGHY